MQSGDACCRVGVDENGLGARLGPLVVTAVLAEVSVEGRALLARPPRELLETKVLYTIFDGRVVHEQQP